MFNSILKSFPHLKHSLTTIHNQELPCFLLHHILISSYSSRVSQNPIPEDAKHGSFAVNYLIKTYGFTPEKAVSTSNRIKLENPDKPDAVIVLLKRQGFSEAQVFQLLRTRPQLLMSNPEKSLLPKFEFLESIGFSKADFPAMIVKEPHLCTRSLEKNIIPSFNLLEKFLCSKEKAVAAIARYPSLLTHFGNHMVPNIEILRKFGVPEAGIRRFLTVWVRPLTYPPRKFEKIVEEVVKLGFDPSVWSSFCIAIKAFGLNRSSWDHKIEVYKRWGCSIDEVLASFVKYPWCMLISEKKIDEIMGYFVNVMGWTPSMVVQTRNILSYSLKRRIIPRCSVYRVLVSKSVTKNLPSVQTWLLCSEESFRKRWLEYYGKQAPEILKLYEETLKLPK